LVDTSSPYENEGSLVSILIMAEYPSLNDRDFDLWKKIAKNLYSYATANGVTGLTAPSLNDTVQDLLRKVCDYTAGIASL